jgi:PAS domain S-box-containing protein
MFKIGFNSIKTKVRIFFIINIALVVGNYFFQIRFNAISEENRKYLEISKENEKYIERIKFFTSSIIDNPDEEKGIKILLVKEIANYRDNLTALDKGGTAIINGGREPIDIKTPPSSGRGELRDLKLSWNELEDLLKKIQQERSLSDTTISFRDFSGNQNQSTPTPVDSSFIDLGAISDTSTAFLNDSLFLEPIDNQDNNQETITSYLIDINPEVERISYLAETALEEVVSKNRELSEIYEDVLDNSQSVLRFILFFTFFLNFLLLTGGTFLFGSLLLRPLKNIATDAKNVASGDIETQISYKNRKDEIGEVADSLNLIVESFQQYTTFANNIGQSNFDTGFEVKSEKDTLGYTLLSMRNSLKSVADDDKKRNWSNEGFALFGNILRSSEKEVEEFSYQIISNLVKYLEANQGGLFILEEDAKEPYLEMKAAFAYDKRKYDEKKIFVGQGLLGQVVLEKDIIYLDNAPNQYIQITSGLGHANPKHLLLSPLKVNNEVLGAIEIASFKPFEAHEIDFVEKISENIASTLAAVKVSKNTERLLEETRQYAEQMQAQEEEMRQNMEMLAITQDEMERNQRKLEEYKINLEKEVENRTAELIDKENALANTLAQRQAIIDSAKSGIVALDTEYRVVAANERSKEIIKMIYSVEFREGDYWFDIFKDEDTRIHSKKLWDRALGKNYHNIEESHLIEGGLRKWFDIAYNPIQNEYNEVIGASMFIRDITQRMQNQKNTELTAYILDNSTNEVYIFDAKTLNFTYVNERGRNNLGYNMKDLRDQTPYGIEPYFDRSSFVEYIQPLQEGIVNNLVIETTFNRKDGTSYEVEMNMQFFKDEETPLFAAIVQDISQRKQNQLKLTEALNRFDLATSATNEGFWEMNISPNDPVNPDNQALWSKRFTNLLGFEEDEFEPKLNSWSSRLHPDDRERVLRVLYDHITDTSGKTPYDLEYRLLLKEGQYAWFAASAATQRNAQGQPIRIAGSIRNINRRKKAEQALNEQIAVVNGIFNASVNSIISIDANHRIKLSNPATTRIFGYTADELLGQEMKILFNKKNMLKLEDTHEDVKTVKVKHKDGHTFEMKASVSETVVDNQKTFVVILREIVVS